MAPTTDTLPNPRTVFTVRGTDPVALEVAGCLDAGAVAGFRAVADWLLGARVVTLDLRSCELDPTGDLAVAAVVEGITDAGGNVTVRA